MDLLLAFSPFLAFLAGERTLGIVPGLCAGAAAAAALLVRERLRGTREPRLLALGTAVLFGLLAACAACVDGVAWSVGLVRLVVDLGLMLVVLAGVALGRPFTLAAARERVTPARAGSREFRRVQAWISTAWALAFGVLALADLLLILRPAWPLAVPLAVGAAGVAGAMQFTRRLTARAAASERGQRDADRISSASVATSAVEPGTVSTTSTARWS